MAARTDEACFAYHAVLPHLRQCTRIPSVSQTRSTGNTPADRVPAGIMPAVMAGHPDLSQELFLHVSKSPKLWRQNLNLCKTADPRIILPERSLTNVVP